MYGHPLLMRKWARIMKPAAPRRLVEQARVMREAKMAKREFLTRQKSLFEDVL